MSMTLEEAIEHAEKVAEENEKISLYTPVEYIPADLSIEQCQNCADDHRQLAAWLRELKERREQEVIHCKDCENWDTTWQNDSAPNYHYCPMIDGTYSGDFYCAKAERRTDADD